MAEPLYLTWAEGDDDAKNIAMARAGAALERVQPILRTSGDEFAAASVTVRDSFSREDFERRRRPEALPLRIRDIIRRCMDSYDEFGIVRNTIDLMADFAAQGINLSHPVEEIERFYKEWFRRVSGPERTERFLNLLYRCGNVVCRRLSGKLQADKVAQFKRAVSARTPTAFDDASPGQGELPHEYFYLNPLVVWVEGEELAPFMGKKNFVFMLSFPPSMFTDFRDDRTLFGLLPSDLQNLVQKGVTKIPLDKKKLILAYYKRDDWLVWAKPMVYSILQDLDVLRKLRLADKAALDGIISAIRIWKLGDIANRIMPTEAAINRLASMLATNVGGGVMDLVWGPELTLQETSTQSHQYLGDAKYSATLTAIRDGLGIVSKGGGLGENFMSMKTLIERLQYGRARAKEMWEEEVRLVQYAMGFKKPATVVFDRKLMADEASEKALMIQLLDRSGVSLETIQDAFGFCPEVEAVRLRREAKRRKQGKLPAKASPWHDPQQEYGLKKLLATSGAYTAGELGVQLDERPKGQKAPLEMKGAQDAKKLRGQPQQGRPKNSKDKQKRKRKKLLGRAVAVQWAVDAQNDLAELATPAFLAACGKGSLRELTEQDARRFEAFKFAALNGLALGEVVTEEVLTSLLSKPLPVPAPVAALLAKTLEAYQAQAGREPTVEVRRRAQAMVVALWRESEGAADEAGDIADGPSQVS